MLEAIFDKSTGTDRDYTVEYNGILVLCQHSEKKISNVVFELLGEGRRLAAILNTKVISLIIGSNVDKLAQQLIAYGADIVYVADYPELKHHNDEIYGDILYDAICKCRPEIVLIGATTYGRAIAPKVASRLNTGLTADCIKLDIDCEKRLLQQTRPAFGGQLMATVICEKKKPQMATIRPKVMASLEPDCSRKGNIIKLQVTVPKNPKIKMVDITEFQSEMENLSEADIIVAFGRGLCEARNTELIKNLADVLGASVGASRAAVDSGWIGYEHQIGQSGITVKPKIYFACGISGSVQHLAGMASSDIIIAINTDPNAPIFKIANYGIVGDIREIIPAMINKLEEVRRKYAGA